MNWILSFLIFSGNLASGADLKSVPEGTYRPLLAKGKTTPVAAFQIDETAVTNSDFQLFVKSHPEWRRGVVKALFADSKYLHHWRTGVEVGDKSLEKAPVVNVSWFAAKAYCESRQMRLPTVDEWEYLAQFGPESGKGDVKSIILEWYSAPTPEVLPNVRTTFSNRFGVWDVHGLIWEWNYDFNTAFVTGESRGDTALEKSMFCGSGAVGAADPSDYAAFMRFGFRSSLKGNFTVANLGFRCVKEIQK